jgi:tetratricopeptide (TPR) repeat protein
MLKLSVVALRFAFLALVFLQVSGCDSPEERAQRHYERGKQLLAQSDHVKAAIEFKNALQLKQDMVGAWRGLAQIEEGKQNWEGLVAILRKVGELDPKDVETKLRYARLMLMGNALDEALKSVNAAGELDERHTGARVLKAAILLKLNDSNGAIREAKAALEAEPTNAEAHIVLAGEKSARGDNEDALALLEHASAANKDNFGVQLFKLRIYERMGDPKRVESLLKELVQANPKEVVYRKQLVKHYVDQKRPADAERELRAIASVNPKDQEAGLDVARYLYGSKGTAAARQELHSRVASGGDVFAYQVALAELYFAEGNFTDAAQLLEKLAGGAGPADQTLLAQSKLAEMYLSSKKFEPAATLVANILAKDGRNTAGLKLRASLHMEQGKHTEAIADLRQALADQPRSVDLMSTLAIAYERSGSIELADKQFTDASRASNFDPRVGLDYVAFLRRRGSLARAEDALVELASRAPGNVEVLSALAEVRLTRQNWVGAQEVADAMRRIGDTRGAADQVLGAALSGQKKHDESIGILQNAHAASPGDVQPMFALVNALVRAQKVDRAEAFLQSVISNDPANAEAHVLMGSTQLLRNAPDQASKSFSAAIERQPKKTIGYRALADLQIRQGQPDDALKVIRAGLQAQPDSLALRLVLAGLLEIKGDYEQAISEYDTMLKQDSGSMIVANNLASLLTDYRSDRASHERAYTLALGLRKSQVPQFKDTLGWVHYHRGEHKMALPYLEEAVAELPDVAMVRYHAGMNYVALGESAKATEQFTKALELASADSPLGEKVRAAMQQSLKN